ncbi:MAG: stage III sporulation AC/AD family protein [Oscillospiraceae bacterium]|nr:stage III sporulation AC/AD family protein [Oscillospiraceae bacterium]
MELIVRIAAVALLGCGAGLLLKRNALPMVLPLSLAVCAFVLFLSMDALRPVLETVGQAKSLSGLAPAYFAPVMKCVVIGLFAKTAADICRDGGHTAMAGAVEYGGAAAALWVSLPLLQTLFGLLERLL